MPEAEDVRPDVSPLVADRLIGAEAIAIYLGLPLRQVHYLREARSTCPIRKLDGIGLYAFKSELDAWMTAPETLASRSARLEDQAG